MLHKCQHYGDLDQKIPIGTIHHILNAYKRNNFRACFDNFEAEKIAHYREQKIAALMDNPGIIRHRLKIHAIVTNAQAYLKIKEECGSFSSYIWSFVNHRPIQNHWECDHQIPAHTSISVHMAHDLKKRGFKFTGSTICYAFMQATGMVNDHTVKCFRFLS